jgi:dienelactone hydrolase
MTGNPLQLARIAVRMCALAGVLALMTGCGFKLAGPAETVSIAALPTEDMVGPCKFDMNLPDEPLADLSQQPTTPEPTESAALVIYERGDSATLFNDPQVQTMAASLHMVTVFAHQCNSKTTGDIQGDATKGQGRMLFAALTQYATDSHHPEIANLKLVLSGFSAAGTLTTTMAAAYPDRVLAFIPHAAGDYYLDLDGVAVPPATAKIPALVLANAYDPDSGDQRSLRYFKRGWSQGAPWAFGVQNHTAHCCAASIRDLMIPWVTALVQPLVPATTGASAALQAAGPVNWAAQAASEGPTVRFWCYTDGFYDSYGEANCWIYSASVLPSTDGGPQAAWLPDTASANAWLTWVLNPGTN